MRGVVCDGMCARRSGFRAGVVVEWLCSGFGERITGTCFWMYVAFVQLRPRDELVNGRICREPCGGWSWMVMLLTSCLLTRI